MVTKKNANNRGKDCICLEDVGIVSFLEAQRGEPVQQGRRGAVVEQGHAVVEGHVGGVEVGVHQVGTRGEEGGVDERGRGGELLLHQLLQLVGVVKCTLQMQLQNNSLMFRKMYLTYFIVNGKAVVYILKYILFKVELFDCPALICQLIGNYICSYYYIST